MKTLSDCRENIHSCSKCGLCQSVCPIYKITGNDCAVSRGQFIMLQGLIKGDIKMSKTINKYLDLCLKCGACSKFCPSGIDVVQIIALAKAEYFKQHSIERIKSLILKTGIKLLYFINKIFPKKKSNKFEKKVIYYGGCGGVNESVIKILNSLNIEVITPNFDCCGFPFFVRGDIENFTSYMDNFFAKLDKYGDYDIVTNCATCEKTLKSYEKWYKGDKKYNVKNVFEYIKESKNQLELKKNFKVTYHKPCNMENWEDIKWILNNTKNLEYVEMNNFDNCCGGVNINVFNPEKCKIMSTIHEEKHNNIKETKAKIVLTSCLACKITLSLFSKFKYRVDDFIDFLAKNLI